MSRPAHASSGSIVRKTIMADVTGIQELFEADCAYFEIVQGAPPGPAEFQSLITERARSTLLVLDVMERAV